MLNINFVPDDYINNNETRRTNLLYVGLSVIVMVALSGSFVTIKIRQRALNIKEKLIQSKLDRAKGDIKKFEELQSKFRLMSKTALTTTELLETLPRSVLLASLTNNLPEGVSLLRLKLIQKKPKKIPRSGTTSKYESAKNKGAADQNTQSKEKLLETHIDIEGISPTDLQVASYIEQLSCSALIDNVSLVESKEFKRRISAGTKPAASDTPLRQFKLKAKLKKDVHITNNDVEHIRKMGQKKFKIF